MSRLLAAGWRLVRWYRRLHGEPGVRCGGCGAPPGAGETLCLDCWASGAAAP